MFTVLYLDCTTECLECCKGRKRQRKLKQQTSNGSWTYGSQNKIKNICILPEEIEFKSEHSSA